MRMERREGEGERGLYAAADYGPVARRSKSKSTVPGRFRCPLAEPFREYERSQDNVTRNAMRH